jgi:hypothetical protein
VDVDVDADVDVDERVRLAANVGAALAKVMSS